MNSVEMDFRNGANSIRRRYSVIRTRRSLLSWILIGMVAFLPAAGIVRAAEPSLNQDEVRELHRQAVELFHKANVLAATNPREADPLYRKAVLRYEKIVNQGGIRNGKIFYNIGNGYFKTGDIGRAILNYRRALRYIPNDENLRQNLQVARAKRVDRIEAPQTQQAMKILFFWHYDFSSHTRLILFSLFFALFWIAAALRLFFRKSYLFRALVFSAVLALLFLGSLLTEAYQDHLTPPGVIVSKEVAARKGDSHSYERSFKDPLHAGTEFVLLEKRGNWCRIQLLDSRKCWIPAGDLEMVLSEKDQPI